MLVNSEADQRGIRLFLHCPPNSRRCRPPTAAEEEMAVITQRSRTRLQSPDVTLAVLGVANGCTVAGELDYLAK